MPGAAGIFAKTPLPSLSKTTQASVSRFDPAGTIAQTVSPAKAGKCRRDVAGNVSTAHRDGRDVACNVSTVSINLKITFFFIVFLFYKINDYQGIAGYGMVALRFAVFESLTL
jgi:hypothetical protein